MKKTVLAVWLIALVAAGVAGATEGSPFCSPRGERLFRKHCQGCHRNTEHLRYVNDVVSVMRNPTPPMPMFTTEKISDRDAAELADYIHYGHLVPGRKQR